MREGLWSVQGFTRGVCPRRWRRWWNHRHQILDNAVLSCWYQLPKDRRKAGLEQLLFPHHDIFHEIFVHLPSHSQIFPITHEVKQSWPVNHANVCVPGQHSIYLVLLSKWYLSTNQKQDSPLNHISSARSRRVPGEWQSPVPAIKIISDNEGRVINWY